ncbi:NAD-dependent epimerase/dehydratase family protein [Herbaspirillum sp. DW155]|nr:NAD-dependent epimerase/dehydratase family protein [Herbaspirillum sp. DW155]
MDRVSDIAGQITWLDIDTASAADLATFFEGGSVVINTVGNYCRQGERVSAAVEANLLFGLKILEAAISAKVGCFINTATSLPKATNTYTRSKAQFSEWGRTLAEANSIMFIDVLLEHMYGPGDDVIKFVEYIIKACVDNLPRLELTAGTQQRDFIYIEDVVSAYLTLVRMSDKLGPVGYHDVAVGSGETISVRSLVESVHAIVGSSTVLDFGARPTSPTEVMHSCADLTKMRALGWSPRMPLREGLEHTVARQRVRYESRSN